MHYGHGNISKFRNMYLVNGLNFLFQSIQTEKAQRKDKEHGQEFAKAQPHKVTVPHNNRNLILRSLLGHPRGEEEMDLGLNSHR